MEVYKQPDMAKRFLIRDLAEQRGISEIDLLKEALAAGGYEQREAAALLGVSQSAISEAMKRLKFIRIVRWLPESEAS